MVLPDAVAEVEQPEARKVLGTGEQEGRADERPRPVEPRRRRAHSQRLEQLFVHEFEHSARSPAHNVAEDAADDVRGAARVGELGPRFVDQWFLRCEQSRVFPALPHQHRDHVRNLPIDIILVEFETAAHAKQVVERNRLSRIVLFLPFGNCRRRADIESVLPHKDSRQCMGDALGH